MKADNEVVQSHSVPFLTHIFETRKPLELRYTSPRWLAPIELLGVLHKYGSCLNAIHLLQDEQDGQDCRCLIEWAFKHCSTVNIDVNVAMFRYATSLPDSIVSSLTLRIWWQPNEPITIAPLITGDLRALSLILPISCLAALPDYSTLEELKIRLFGLHLNRREKSLELSASIANILTNPTCRLRTFELRGSWNDDPLKQTDVLPILDCLHLNKSLTSISFEYADLGDSCIEPVVRAWNTHPCLITIEFLLEVIDHKVCEKLWQNELPSSQSLTTVAVCHDRHSQRLTKYAWHRYFLRNAHHCHTWKRAAFLTACFRSTRNCPEIYLRDSALQLTERIFNEELEVGVFCNTYKVLPYILNWSRFLTTKWFQQMTCPPPPPPRIRRRSKRTRR